MTGCYSDFTPDLSMIPLETPAAFVKTNVWCNFGMRRGVLYTSSLDEPMSASISRTEQYIIACLFVLFLGASLLRIYTEQPLGDEAYFATPAYNLIWHGYMGASNLDASNPIQTGINDHSYWTVPLYFLLTAGWYKLVGFGLFRARILPLLFSSGGLIALFYV